MDEDKKIEINDLDKIELNHVDIDDIDNLRNLTDNRVIQRASGDIVSAIQDEENTFELVGKKPGSYYRDLIFAIIQIRLPEEEAKRDWKEILKHKYLLSEKLGRNVGIHVASLDYYTNIKRRMINPKIVDVQEYVDTASRSIIDQLTKAYNRRFFDREFKRLFIAARRGGSVYSLIMLDVDHFKVYNDINGHIQGDIALIETVRILHAVCSSNDIVTRYGGEEFAILLPGVDLQSALSTAEHIRGAIYDYRFVNEHRLPGGRFSASLGVTTYRPDIKTPLDLIQEADVALYRAKNGGRNQVRAFLNSPDA